MDTIEIKSTRLGLSSSLFSSLFWTIVPCACILILLFVGYDFFKSTEYKTIMYIVMTMAIIVFAIIALVSVYNFFITLVYEPKDEIIIYVNYTNQKLEPVKISSTSFSFVNTKHYTESLCNRILRVDISTPILGSFSNTGTMTISFVSSDNDFYKESWIIRGVKNPEIIKKMIFNY